VHVMMTSVMQGRVFGNCVCTFISGNATMGFSLYRSRYGEAYCICAPVNLDSEYSDNSCVPQCDSPCFNVPQTHG